MDSSVLVCSLSCCCLRETEPSGIDLGLPSDPWNSGKLWRRRKVEFTPSVFTQNNRLWGKIQTDFVAVLRRSHSSHPPTSEMGNRGREGTNAFVHERCEAGCPNGLTQDLGSPCSSQVGRAGTRKLPTISSDPKARLQRHDQPQPRDTRCSCTLAPTPTFPAPPKPRHGGEKAQRCSSSLTPATHTRDPLILNLSHLDLQTT